MAEEECLVRRRQKRSTAGNRMEVALAELALEELQETEEDIDFVVENAALEEEDIFESDFASTDEEAVPGNVDEEDRSVREEKRRERKTARARIEKATAAAHARQRVTFNPEASTSQRRSAQKPKRRVSLGVVVNAETGEVIEGGAGSVGAKRQSQRRHTIMNTSATVNRIKDAEEKRAAIPKKTKTATRLPTQDELIARALDTEEGNITEHKNYLHLEEEKRAKARVVKQSIEGPVLRWVSKKETIQVEVQLSPPPLPPPTTSANTNLYAAKYNFVYSSGTGGTVGSHAYSVPFYAYMPLVAQGATSKLQEAGASAMLSVPTSSSRNLAVASAGTLTSSISPATQTTPSLPSTPSSHIQNSTIPTTSAISIPSASSGQQQQQPQQPALASAPAQAQIRSLPVSFPYPPTPTTPIIAHRTEDVCKNYVIHQLSQSVPSKPPWIDTMSAMFGDHVQWGEVKVFTGKGRPLCRPVRTCPITGQPAKYCDPRTNVPFANVAAYDVLTKLIGRGYVWCSALGCYVGVNETSRQEGPGDGGRSRDTDKSKGVEVTAEQGDGNIGDGGLDERTTKRRRVEVADD